MSIASGVKVPLPNSRVTISLEKIMAPMVAGITNKLITEMASEMEFLVRSYYLLLHFRDHGIKDC